MERIFHDGFFLIVIKPGSQQPGMVINCRGQIGLYPGTVFSNGELRSGKLSFKVRFFISVEESDGQDRPFSWAIRLLSSSCFALSRSSWSSGAISWNRERASRSCHCFSFSVLVFISSDAWEKRIPSPNPRIRYPALRRNPLILERFI